MNDSDKHAALSHYEGQAALAGLNPAVAQALAPLFARHVPAPNRGSVCDGCSGSGAGRYERTWCNTCGGTGSL